MRRLNKLCAGALSAMMICSAFSFPAFALGGETTSFDIKKNVTVSEGANNPNETYQFKIAPETVADGAKTEDNLKLYTGIELGDDEASKSITFDADAEETDGVYSDHATVDLSKVAYDKPGAYRYRVTETAGTTKGMQYDETEYLVDVYVGYANNGSGDLQIESVRAVNETNHNAKTNIEFNNAFTAQNLEVKKVVTGTQGDKEEQFDFTITIQPEQTVLPENCELEGTIVRKDGSKENIAITVGKACEFKLADQDVLTVAGVPEGVNYQVEESDYTQEGYITTTEDTDQGVMDDNGAAVTVTNAKNVTVKTGINMNMMPYVLVVIFAAGTATVLFVRRKMNGAQ